MLSGEAIVDNSNMTTKFNSLNFWRRAYLILLWAFTMSIFAAMVFIHFFGNSGIKSGHLVLAALLVLLTAWTHYAIVNRKIIHLKLIAMINLIPFFNIIGTLITLSIIKVTREEINSSRG